LLSLPVMPPGAFSHTVLGASTEHHAKLDEFLRRWWADSGVGTWRPDYTRAVVLR
jgi:hypothetical protein